MTNVVMENTTLSPNYVAKESVQEYIKSWGAEVAELTPFIIVEGLLKEAAALVRTAEEVLPPTSVATKNLEIFVTKGLISRDGLSVRLAIKLIRLGQADALKRLGLLALGGCACALCA